MKRMFASGWARSLAAGIAGFVVYGAWAWYVNQAHGQAVGIRAGLIQGSYSLALTLTTTLMMEYLLNLLKDIPGQVWLTIAATSVITFSTAYAIHFVFGTPEILMTILPGFLSGTVYTVTYVVSVHRLTEAESR